MSLWFSINQPQYDGPALNVTPKEADMKLKHSTIAKVAGTIAAIFAVAVPSATAQPVDQHSTQVVALVATASQVPVATIFVDDEQPVEGGACPVYDGDYNVVDEGQWQYDSDIDGWACIDPDGQRSSLGRSSWGRSSWGRKTVQVRYKSAVVGTIVLT
jgi:hypothetical protein